MGYVYCIIYGHNSWFFFVFMHASGGDGDEQSSVFGTPAVDEADEDGHTPFFAACRGGHLGVARLLAGAGAAVGQAGNDGCTPLHVAARNGHAEVVRWLLSLQAGLLPFS